MTIAVLGGTGPQGRGLALRWAVAGQQVVIGSRDAARAQQVAGELGHGITGAANLQAAQQADIVLVRCPTRGIPHC